VDRAYGHTATGGASRGSSVRSDPVPLAALRQCNRAAQGVLRRVRKEEWVLLIALAAGSLLCASTRTGFQPVDVFRQYVNYFAPYVVYLFVASRIVWWVMPRWQPEHALARRFKGWLLGNGNGQAGAFETDLEVARGMLLQFATLSIYTNVKTRIPFINPVIGDPVFLRADELLFGTGWISWLEQVFASSPALTQFFGAVYLHGYLYMVVLLFLVYVRQDRFMIRWMFISVSSVYISAILITVVLPSYGPFHLEAGRFAWLFGTEIGDVQQKLEKFVEYSHWALSVGQPVRAFAFLGIAAFPSLHIGHMVILMVIALRVWRCYAGFMASMVALTFVATVAFGWHYAVDAIGGAVLAVAVTHALYRTLQKRHRASPPDRVDPT
jgi:hypothetical protein